MDMKFIGIVIGSILLLVILYYAFVESPKSNNNDGKTCKTNDGKNGIMTGGVCTLPKDTSSNSNLDFNPNPVPVVPLPLKVGSTSVNIADTAQAVVNFSGMSENNLASYNILTSAGSNPNKIHYTTGFASQCFPNIWYKNWLYSYRGSEIDQSGNKTCYYGVNKSVLPASIQVQLTGSECKNYKLYISGVEYKYSKNIVGGGSIISVPLSYCVYTKQ